MIEVCCSNPGCLNSRNSDIFEEFQTWIRCCILDLIVTWFFYTRIFDSAILLSSAPPSMRWRDTTPAKRRNKNTQYSTPKNPKDSPVAWTAWDPESSDKNQLFSNTVQETDALSQTVDLLCGFTTYHTKTIFSLHRTKTKISTYYPTWNVLLRRVDLELDDRPWYHLIVYGVTLRSYPPYWYS